jgi:D-3-phosphoglycerate dehydrogenase
VSRFSAVLIDQSPDAVPGWVLGALAEAGIDFVHQPCATREELLAVAEACDILWIYGGNRLATAENLRALEQCRAVIRSGSGVDVIDVDTATELGMIVVNTPHAHDDAVSDHAIALIFAVGRRIAQQDRAMRLHGWTQRNTKFPTWKLRQRTLGLVGFGNIPRFLVRKLVGFDLRVLAYDPFVDATELETLGVESVDFETLLSEADIVSLHTPLTAGTHHLIDEAALRHMQPTAMLINTSRGPVVDEHALITALEEGWIAGAGLDVFEEEPTPANSPILALDTVVATPHTAGISDESFDLTWRLSVEACIDLKNGFYPRSYVNHSVTPRQPLQPSQRAAGEGIATYRSDGV